MFRYSGGQRSGTRIVSVFSSEDLPDQPVVQTYSYTGVDQTILVPFTGFCEYILWGAAGSRGLFSSTLIRGGAGGTTTGILAVTGGESLIAIVGQGGLSPNASVESRAGGYGGSGSCFGDSGYYPGRGGGRSAIRRTSTELATAGGGGGASWSTGTEGGVGGGTTGGSAGVAGGGTQSAGGAAASGGTAGSAFQGGNAALYGGSGGGGLFGGGGGRSNVGGGGGSGFAGGTSALTYQGTGATPPLNTDPRYPGGGVGTSNDTNDQAGHGFIHLRFFV